MSAFSRSAIAALLLAGALSACAPQDDKDGPASEGMQSQFGRTVVAKVNGSPIYLSDVQGAAQLTGQIQQGDELSRDNPVFASLLDEMVNQRLLALNAKTSGLSKSKTAKTRIAVARERILANMALEAHLKSAVTDAAAQALYDEQIKLRQTGQEARASHILVKSEDEAKAIAKRLTAGEDFAALATELSLDRGSQTAGGDLGWFQADAMVASFSAAVFALEDGEVSAPFESEFGWHIAKLTGKRDAPAPSFEQMKPEITNFLTMREISRFTDMLREDADIETFPVPEEPAPANIDDVSAPGADAPSDAPSEDEE